MSDKLNIKQAAVLGAGVMGAQIAAFLVNAGVKTYLFDLPSNDGNPNAIASGAIKALSKLKPAPLAIKNNANLIQACNYESDLEQLKQCDFIIEAISERKSFKKELYEKIVPYINEHAVVASNTSGLSVNDLAENFPSKIQSRFLGVHFFNPPRYMKLVECIPHAKTDAKLLEQLEEFLVVRLGKGVVYAKDTPNFVGNRIGVFALLSVLKHAEKYSLAPDVVDALTGVAIGRPKSATFRTMDVVGLDTMKHVVATLKDSLKDDPWAATFEMPTWIESLVNKGHLGQKTRCGIYKKHKGKIVVFDQGSESYRPSSVKVDAKVTECLKLPLTEKFQALQSNPHPQAQFLWSCFRDLFHYCAYHLQDIAQTTRDIDLAMRWGYGWQQGPFEIWQQSDVQAVYDLIHQDIKDGKTLANAAMPNWLDKTEKQCFYKEAQAFSPEKKTFLPRSTLPFYDRQLSPDKVLGESGIEGKIIFENDGLSLWTLNGKDAIVSFKTKKNCISKDVLEGMLEACDRAEKDYASLIIWQKHDHDFSLGANLKEIVGAISSRQFNKIDDMISLFHKVALRLKYASVPTIAAIRGMCLGGGTEFAMHTHVRVAAFESYIGLPEVGIGVIPAGGGTKELALHAYRYALEPHDFNPLQKVFGHVAKAQVSSSAQEASHMWFLRNHDKIVVNRDEVLFEALKIAESLSGPSFYSKIPENIQVSGKAGFANLQAFLVNMREGQFITDHDYTIGCKLAEVFSGGQVDAGSVVDEEWFLALEKAAFMELVESPLTLARIEHTLSTGKPLRN